MEQQLFTWDGWDQHDFATFSYCEVETIVDLPGIPCGSKFDGANVCYHKGVLEFWNDNTTGEVLHKFKLKLQVEEE